MGGWFSFFPTEIEKASMRTTWCVAGADNFCSPHAPILACVLWHCCFVRKHDASWSSSFVPAGIFFFFLVTPSLLTVIVYPCSSVVVKNNFGFFQRFYRLVKQLDTTPTATERPTATPSAPRTETRRPCAASTTQRRRKAGVMVAA